MSLDLTWPFLSSTEPVLRMPQSQQEAVFNPSVHIQDDKNSVDNNVT